MPTGSRPRAGSWSLTIALGLVAIWAHRRHPVPRAHHPLGSRRRSLDSRTSKPSGAPSSKVIAPWWSASARRSSFAFPISVFLRDPKVNDWTDIEKSERLNETRKTLGAKEILPSYNFTGAGEASAAFVLARLLATRKSDLRLTRSSIVSWQQIMDEDVVFVGPPKFNLQLQAAAMKQEIVIEPDGIRNLKPRPGEPAYLPDIMVPGKPSEGETHALISRTPGLSGVGELLVIAGNASPDTFAAAEWLTQPIRARELVQHLRTPSGDIPRYFQVVIKVGFKQGIPVESSYVFHHVVAAPKPAGSK